MTMASSYSSDQIDQYLSYLEIPDRYRRASDPPLNLDFLSTLHTYHLSRIPYENLSLHYSPSRSISLDPQVLYKKIVGEARGRGGYCLENSIFFNHILRGLGFKAYPVGAKIRPRVGSVPQGDYIGWCHVVNIVTIYTTSSSGQKQKQRYAVDISFGGDGAIHPLPLIHEHVVQNIGPQQIRLVHDFIPSQIQQDEDEGAQKMWIYQYRNGEHLPWNSYYAFHELEFTHDDFEIMNWYVSQNPESFQTFTVLVVKFLRRAISKENGEEGSTPMDTQMDWKEPSHRIGQAEIYGKVMIVNSEVKRNLGGKTELIKSCKTESERVDALKEYFGIELKQDEIEGIQGTATVLGSPE